MNATESANTNIFNIKTVSHETAERDKVNKLWFDHKYEKKRDDIENFSEEIFLIH